MLYLFCHGGGGLKYTRRQIYLAVNLYIACLSRGGGIYVYDPCNLTLSTLQVPVSEYVILFTLHGSNIRKL